MSIQWVGLEVLPTHVLFTTMIALGKCIAAMILDGELILEIQGCGWAFRLFILPISPVNTVVAM